HANIACRHIKRLENISIQVGSEAAPAGIVCVQGRRLKIRLELAMPYVRPMLRNSVDHASECATVFGFETAGLDLDFLNKVRLKIFADATVLNVGDVDAVNHVHVFGVRGAINLKS